MINIIRSQDRGHTRTNWLDSNHSYSFFDYYDPDRNGFGKLIVFNEDTILGGTGFGAHPHTNAEIITIVLEGALNHKDSIGNEGTIKKGEVQRMSAGKGVIHSEFNASKKEKTHFIQIWIEPDKIDIEPQYEQKKLKISKNQFVEIVKKEGKNSLSINQDVSIFYNDLSLKKTVNYSIKENRGVYLFVIDGSVKLNNAVLKKGDSVEISDENILSIESIEHSRILLIDTPLLIHPEE